MGAVKRRAWGYTESNRELIINFVHLLDKKYLIHQYLF